MEDMMSEINDPSRPSGKRKFARASVVSIDERERRLRILKALFGSATGLFAAGERKPRLRAGFGERQLGSWPFENVYFYVYEQAVALEPDGLDLATLIWQYDYAAPLLSPVAAK